MTLQPADLDRLEQLVREAQEAVDEGWTGGPPITRLRAALSPAVVSELVAAARLGAGEAAAREFVESITAPAELDAAWQAAEAALPEGAWLEIEGPHDAPDEGKYTVSAFQWTSVPKASRERSEIVRIAKEIATPAAAMLALVEALRRASG